MAKKPELPDIGSTGDIAFDQSIALNKIALTMLEQRKHSDIWIRIILVLSLLTNLIIVGIFLNYESQFTTVETITTTTVEQDTGEGEGNNVYQAGENARYYQGSEAMTDGEANNTNYYGDESEGIK